MEGSCQTFDMLFRGDLRAFFQFYVQWACVSRSTLLPNPFGGLRTRTCFENIVIRSYACGSSGRKAPSRLVFTHVRRPGKCFQKQKFSAARFYKTDKIWGQ